MKQDPVKKLTTTDSVPQIMAKLFPKPGVFDEAAFKTLTASGDRDRVYKDVNDAEAKLTPADQKKMLLVFVKAIAPAGRASGDTHGLEQVFGRTNVGKAQIIYIKAMGAMLTAMVDMDKALSTDYNRDDPEVNLGGWASFSSKHVHLTREVAQVADMDDSTITIIHEFAHMADSSVDDNGYYGSNGFEAMTESLKLQNAAHFEELPARYLGKSKYVGVTFKPGVTKSGGKATFEDNVRRKASEYLRKAWDKGVDVHTWLRERRQKVEAGNTADFAEGRSSLAVRGPCPAGTCDRGIVDLGTGRARLVGLLDLQGKPASFTPFSDHRAIAPGISQSLGAHARLPAALVIVEHDDAAGAHRADLEVIDLRPTPPNRILDVELTLQQADGGGFAAKHVELSGADADAPLGISITQVTLPGSHDLVAPSQQLVRHRFVLAEGRYIRLE